MSLVTARNNGTLGITRSPNKTDSFAGNHYPRTAHRPRNSDATACAATAGPADGEQTGLEILSVALGRVRDDWRNRRSWYREILWRIGTGGMTVFYCGLIIALSVWIARLTKELRTARVREQEAAKLILELMEGGQ